MNTIHINPTALRHLMEEIRTIRTTVTLKHFPFSADVY